MLKYYLATAINLGDHIVKTTGETAPTSARRRNIISSVIIFAARSSRSWRTSTPGLTIKPSVIRSGTSQEGKYFAVFTVASVEVREINYFIHRFS